MSTVQLLKESNVARFGTYTLVILLYVIYTLGTLLQWGVTGDVVARTAAIRIGGATVAFIVGLALIRWFFERAGD